MIAPVIFVSDVHLRFGDAAYRDVFVRFLEEQVPGAERLYIHGDLFDFYVGPRQGRHPFYAPVFDALRALVAAGCRVSALGGNRDFLLGGHLARQGVAILPDGVTLELGGRRVHLSHGDAFCIHDRSYQFWARGVLRLAPVRLAVRSLPLWAGFWLARRYRRISSRKVARLEPRSTGRLPSILDGAQAFVAAEGHDVLICGHIHELAETALEAGGRRARLLTTGAWETSPNCILFDGEDFRLLSWDVDGARAVPSLAALAAGA